MPLSSEQQNLLALHSGEQQPPASKQLLSNDAYVTVLQRADGEHISGKLDLEDHISGLQDCIRQLQREPELTTLCWSLLELLTSKKCEPPAAPQMVPLGSPSAQAWGLSRGSAGAHKSDIIYF
jgi:hypothetical protein